MFSFTDDDYLTATQKTTILGDWRTFIRNGFRFEDFSQLLYDFLIQRCSFIARFNRLQFWTHYFHYADLDLMVFLAQFGSEEKSSAEGFYGRYWHQNASADVIEAMFAEMTTIYPILRETLNDLAVGQYEAERQSALTLMLIEAREEYPDQDEAGLRDQIARFYDGLRPLDEYDAQFILTDKMRDQLTQAVAAQVHQVDHPSIFALRGWLDATGRRAPDMGGQVNEIAQATLFDVEMSPIIDAEDTLDGAEMESTIPSHVTEEVLIHDETRRLTTDQELAAIKARLATPIDVDGDTEVSRDRLQDEDQMLAPIETATDANAASATYRDVGGAR